MTVSNARNASSVEHLILENYYFESLTITSIFIWWLFNAFEFSDVLFSFIQSLSVRCFFY